MARKIPHRIAVIYGGLGPEAEICTIEGKRIIKLLVDNHHDVFEVLVSKKSNFLDLLKGAPKQAILCLTEDISIQWVLDYYGIRYNGSGSIATSVSLDKALLKDIFFANKISTAAYKVINFSDIKTTTPSKLHKLNYPLVVKPARSGTSSGLSLVETEKELKKALKAASQVDEKLVLEEYISGTEVTVVGLGKEILGIVELDKGANKLYDYETKVHGHVKLIASARISAKAATKLVDTAKRIASLVDVKNLFRIDVIVKDDIPYILELNTLPFLAEGGEPYEAVKGKGMSVYEYLGLIVNDFLEE